MQCSVISYPSFDLELIEAETAAMVPEASRISYRRVELPYAANNAAVMNDKGYVFSDRTLGVAVSLRNIAIDYQRLIRFDTRRAEGERDKEEILQIALNSFPSDSRFHVRPVPDEDTAAAIIRGWVDKLSEPYVCLHKGQIVGFLDLEPFREKDLFVHLAAVQERYRAAGAEVSLYAKAV